MKKTLLAAAALLLAACGTTHAGPGLPGHGNAGVTAPATPAATATAFPASWPMPDRALTPGAIATEDIRRLCPHVDPALEAARPTSAEKARVYQAYGLSYPQPHGEYELDHLVPIELGGAPDSPANEWPQRNDTPSPAALTKYGLDPAFVHNSKDILEDVLHDDVCAGKVALSVAQHAMASDWRQAYVTYVGQP